MTPDDDAYRQVQVYRTRERIIGALLAFSALGSSIMYVVFLKASLGPLWLGLLIAMEWLIMAFIYFIIVSQMRKRRR